MSLKRLLRIVFGLVLLFIIGFGALFASVFVGNKKLEDGAVLSEHAITVNDGYVGIFLLPGSDGAYALVDCGNDLEAKKVLSVLDKRGVKPDAVKAIFLTHGHPDHIAGCNAFKGAPVYAFAGDVAIASGKEAAKSPMGRVAGAQTQKTVTVTNTLEDGKDVEVAGLTVRAYAIPGHTAGSAAYLVRGVLYVGDSLTSKPDGSIIDPPWMFTDDLILNRRSVVALVDRLKQDGADVKTIAFSHTGALSGIDALVKYAEKSK